MRLANHALLLVSLVPPAAAVPDAAGLIATAPVQNFRLPTFNADGHRHLMLRAGEATRPAPDRIQVKEMELTLFKGDASGSIDAMVAAPSASFWPDRQLAEGAESVRLERADLTVTGADWTYDHPGQSVVIRRDARVVFHQTLDKVL